MPNVMVFAAPYVPPPPPVSPWQNYELMWTGWDGSVWDLNDASSGVQVVNTGLVGLHLPPFEPQVSERRTGRRRRGVRVRERTVEIPVLVWHDSSSEGFVELDRAFWRSFHPLKAGTLTVASPGGVRRHIDLVLESDGGHAYDLDPIEAGWSLYQLVLTAEQPYFYGEPITRSFGEKEQGLFFGGDAPDDPGAEEVAPPLYISSDWGTENASMTNPGDVDAWPVFSVTATGSNVDVTFGVGGGEVSASDIPEGSTLVVNTDPNVASAQVDGVDVPGHLAPYDPRPIPAGGETDLDITVSGVGVVSVTITPRYLRAW